MKNSSHFRFSYLVLTAFLVVILATSCSERRVVPAVGSYSDVWLISETGLQSSMVKRFADVLSSPLTYVFETENEFNVFVRNADDFKECTDKKNIVLLVRTDQEGKLRKRVFRTLSSDVLGRVRKDGHLILFKKDLYARDQDIYFLLVNSSVEEDYVLQRLAPMLRDRLRESTKERYRSYLLSAHENKGGAKYLWQRYGFTVRHTSEYHKLQERPDLGAIELHRRDPSRVLGIFWRNEVDGLPVLADSTELFAFRTSIVDSLYGGDYMLPEESQWSRTEIDGRTAIRLKGVWQNDRDMTGGSFITYFVHDSKRRRLLALDLLLYAPGKDKHPYMRELEALAETFRF